MRFKMSEKILLSKTDDFEILAEIVKPIKPESKVYIKVLTRWLNAKDPEDLHTKFSMLVDKKSVKNLQTLVDKIKLEVE